MFFSISLLPSSGSPEAGIPVVECLSYAVYNNSTFFILKSRAKDLPNG